MTAVPGIRHVLLDADGVLQVVPDGGWFALAEPFVGIRAEEFMRRAWVLERPTLAGRGDLRPLLAGLLREYDVAATADELLAAVWYRIEVVEQSFALVESLRRRGYGVHLGTNQDLRRGEHMRTALGYDALFDTSCYSYDLGVAKPDPGFFVAAARRIGCEPAALLFVDDTHANVEGARAAGLAAVHWTVDDGHAALVEALARHGVDASR